MVALVEAEMEVVVGRMQDKARRSCSQVGRCRSLPECEVKTLMTRPARGRFARSDLDRQMASTFPCPLESGPSSRFLGQPATGTRRMAGTTHTESGRR